MASEYVTIFNFLANKNQTHKTNRIFTKTKKTNKQTNKKHGSFPGPQGVPPSQPPYLPQQSRWLKPELLRSVEVAQNAPRAAPWRCGWGVSSAARAEYAGCCQLKRRYLLVVGCWWMLMDIHWWINHINLITSINIQQQHHQHPSTSMDSWGIFMDEIVKNPVIELGRYQG